MTVPLTRPDRRRRLALCSAVMVLFLSTAATAAAGSADDARVTGTVVRGDGSAAAGVRVKVERTDTGVRLVPADAEVVHRTTTDAAGRFTAELPGSYVPGTETDTDWVVSASLPPARGEPMGPTSSFELEVSAAVQEAPSLPLWETRPDVRLEGWHATVSVPGEVPGERPQATVFLRRGPGDTLRERGTTATFDLRLLEPERSERRDLEFGGETQSDVTVRHAEGRTIYHQKLFTATPRLATAPPLVPPSRGASCTITMANGEVSRPRDCPATDGRFDAIDLPGDDTTATSFTVDLGVPLAAGDVFVRLCGSNCDVELSGDGVTWVPARPGRVAAGPLVASSQSTEPIRFVRVSAQGRSLPLTEISAWPATAPPATASPEAGEVPDGGWSDGLRVVASLLVIAVASALAVVAFRRGHWKDRWRGSGAARSANRVLAGVVGAFAAALAALVVVFSVLLFTGVEEGDFGSAIALALLLPTLIVGLLVSLLLAVVAVGLWRNSKVAMVAAGVFCVALFGLGVAVGFERAGVYGAGIELLGAAIALIGGVGLVVLAVNLIDAGRR